MKKIVKEVLKEELERLWQQYNLFELMNSDLLNNDLEDHTPKGRN